MPVAPPALCGAARRVALRAARGKKGTEKKVSAQIARPRLPVTDRKGVGLDLD